MLAHGLFIDELLIAGVPLALVVGLVVVAWRRAQAEQEIADRAAAERSAGAGGDPSTNPEDHG